MTLDFNLNVHVRVEPVTVRLQLDPAFAGTVADHLTEHLNRIERKIESMNTQMVTLWQQVDAETSRIATALEQELADQPEALARVQNHLNQLKAIGANPEQPIPATEETTA